MNKILRELFPNTKPNVLISSVSGEDMKSALGGVPAIFFVANTRQVDNKKVDIKDNYLILPEGEILPHIDYTVCVGTPDDPNMIPTLSNASKMLSIPFVTFFSKPKEAYGSIRWINTVRRSASHLNVFLSDEIAQSWNIKNAASAIADYTDSNVFTEILKKVEEDYYK